MKHSYFLGIDGGGSKCKARLENANGDLLSEFTSGPANPSRDYDLTVSSLREAIQGVYLEAKLALSETKNTYATVGLAGVNIASCLNKMTQWQHPFASLDLTTDLHIACVGAHAKATGAIVIIGTGSSGLICQGGAQIEFGGHGFLLGDKGSGAWFGAQSVSYALECLDGIKNNSLFIDAILQQSKCNTSNQLVESFMRASPSEFARFAPLVFDFAEKYRDPVAVALVQQGADYVNTLCKVMLDHKPSRFAFIGGLAPKIIPWLESDIQSQLSAPLNPPEVGAILLARQQKIVGKKSA